MFGLSMAELIPIAYLCGVAIRILHQLWYTVLITVVK